MLSLGLTYTTHLIIVFVGTFSSIIYFKQLCNKRSFLGTTTLEKRNKSKKKKREELFDSVYDEIHADFLAIVG